MQILKLKIANDVHEQLILYLTKTVLFDYINIASEITILATEEFYLRTNSDQLNVIIIKSVNSQTHIDLIGGGGGSGVFRLTWGSEEAFVKETLRLLKDFCKIQGKFIEIVE